jgi:hypothetical protein
MNDISDMDIFIELPEPEGIEIVSLHDRFEQMRDESQNAMSAAMSTIRAMAYKVSRTIKEIDTEARPDEVEVEFSLKLGFEGGLTVPMVAKTTAGGQFTVTFRWTVDKSNQTKVLIAAKD